jgi:hypothetical protein
MSKNTNNELRKLGATFFNNIGVGFIILGIIGPSVTGKAVWSWETIPYELKAWGTGAIFHFIARWQLWFLED